MWQVKTWEARQFKTKQQQENKQNRSNTLQRCVFLNQTSEIRVDQVHYVIHTGYHISKILLHKSIKIWSVPAHSTRFSMYLYLSIRRHQAWLTLFLCHPHIQTCTCAHILIIKFLWLVVSYEFSLSYMMFSLCTMVCLKVIPL